MTSITFQELTKRVFFTTIEPDSVNIGLVLGDNGALLVDTGSSPSQGAELRQAAQEFCGKDITHVVITHGHRDHCFGLAAFADCESYAHANAKDWPADELLQRDAQRLGGFEICIPKQLFSMVKAFDLGNQRVELVHGGTAHSQSDIVMILPQENVVFVGDLWEESAPPCYGTDTDVIGWAKALDTVMGAFAEDTQLVVGHGKPVTRQWALAERMKIGAIPAIVEWLIAKGIPEDQALDYDTEWPWPKSVIEKILPIAYPQLKERGIKYRRNLPMLQR